LAIALTDALGNLVRFVLMPGHRFDTVGVAPLIDGLAFEGFIADKAFDSNSIIADLNERGAKIVISQHPRRASPLRIDAEIYNWRHLIENFFCKLKEFKRIAMRADKTDQSFAANIHLAAAVKIPDESQQTLVGRLANLSRHTLVRRRQGPRNIYARHTAPVAPAKAIPSRA
jgi:transposase